MSRSQKRALLQLYVMCALYAVFILSPGRAPAFAVCYVSAGVLASVAFLLTSRRVDR